MLQIDKRSGTFYQPSSAGEVENGSVRSKNAPTSNEDETADEVDDERVEKSCTLPLIRQLNLYNRSYNIDGNQHNGDDSANEHDYDDEEEDESEDEEEDPNEICRKLQRVCNNSRIPIETLCVMFKLFSQLRNGDYIK